MKDKSKNSLGYCELIHVGMGSFCENLPFLFIHVLLIKTHTDIVLSDACVS